MDFKYRITKMEMYRMEIENIIINSVNDEMLTWERVFGGTV